MHELETWATYSDQLEKQFQWNTLWKWGSLSDNYPLIDNLKT